MHRIWENNPVINFVHEAMKLLRRIGTSIGTTSKQFEDPKTGTDTYRNQFAIYALFRIRSLFC